MIRQTGTYSDNAIVQAITDIAVKSENVTDNTLLLKNRCPFTVAAMNDRILFSAD